MLNFPYCSCDLRNDSWYYRVLYVIIVIANIMFVMVIRSFFAFAIQSTQTALVSVWRNKDTSFDPARVKISREFIYAGGAHVINQPWPRYFDTLNKLPCYSMFFTFYCPYKCDLYKLPLCSCWWSAGVSIGVFMLLVDLFSYLFIGLGIKTFFV